MGKHSPLHGFLPRLFVVKSQPFALVRRVENKGRYSLFDQRHAYVYIRLRPLALSVVTARNYYAGYRFVGFE